MPIKGNKEVRCGNLRTWHCCAVHFLQVRLHGVGVCVCLCRGIKVINLSSRLSPRYTAEGKFTLSLKQVPKNVSPVHFASTAGGRYERVE